MSRQPFEYDASGHPLHLPAMPALPLLAPYDADHCRYCRFIAHALAIWDGGSELGTLAVMELLDTAEGSSLATITEWRELGVVNADAVQLMALLIVHAAVMHCGGSRCRAFELDLDKLLQE